MYIESLIRVYFGQKKCEHACGTICILQSELDLIDQSRYNYHHSGGDTFAVNKNVSSSVSLESNKTPNEVLSTIKISLECPILNLSRSECESLKLRICSNDNECQRDEKCCLNGCEKKKCIG